jgi:phospholipase C
MPGNDAANAIQHVFVLMLENRSFDHMFALSGIPGIHAATYANTNSFDGVDYHFQGGAPDRMPSDPSHGFCSVLEQLCGPGSDCSNTSPYPTRDNSGFVANYAATTVRSGIFGRKHPLPAADRGKIMLGADTATQTPALQMLATQYALCDEWYSSLPGPTWPNRFFVHGASSDGLADAPGFQDILKWESVDGFEYPNGSIYDLLGPGNFRLYQDKSGPLSGRIPQVAALKGISFFDVHRLRHLERDLEQGIAASYTFIEPAYGDIVFDTYRGGSSQHPMDGLAGGDRLVARVYNAIRNSPVWPNSLLIITYDEHGGFYDSGIPAHAAPPPGDGTGPHQNPHKFDFSVYGVRVPAVIVSPWIARGTVDHELYDHASVLATVEGLFGLDPLTDRDAGANDLRRLLTGPLRPDSDCPSLLPEAPEPISAPDAEELARAPEDEPVEDRSNLQAFLYVVAQAHGELATKTEALTRFQAAKTRGDAQRYLEEVMPQLDAAREARSGPVAT